MKSSAAAAPSSALSGHSESPSDITGVIFETVRCRQVCDMEDLLKACSSYSWNQVFLEVDRMSRSGELRLLSKRTGGYAVTLPAA